MIVNIRGTNGSGKSTLVRNVMARCSSSKAIYGLLGPNQPEAYQLSFGFARPVFVIGPYQTNIGGCDRIQPYENIIALLDKYAAKGHVLFEGSLVSDNIGTVGEWLEAQREATVVFMDTPLKVCIENILKRTPDGSTKNVEKRYLAIARVRAKLLERGKVAVLDVSMRTGLDKVLEALGVDQERK